MKQRRVRAITLQRAIEQPISFLYILNYFSCKLRSHTIIQKYCLCDNTFLIWCCIGVEVEQKRPQIQLMIEIIMEQNEIERSRVYGLSFVYKCFREKEKCYFLIKFGTAFGSNKIGRRGISPNFLKMY